MLGHNDVYMAMELRPEDDAWSILGFTPRPGVILPAVSSNPDMVPGMRAIASAHHDSTGNPTKVVRYEYKEDLPSE